MITIRWLVCARTDSQIFGCVTIVSHIALYSHMHSLLHNKQCSQTMRLKMNFKWWKIFPTLSQISFRYVDRFSLYVLTEMTG